MVGKMSASSCLFILHMFEHPELSQAELRSPELYWDLLQEYPETQVREPSFIFAQSVH